MRKAVATLESSATETVTAPATPLPSRSISLIRYSPALVVLAILIADAYRLADPDLWGHIRFGQMFLASGQVSATDPFNYSVPNHLWMHHEWLAEALMGWLFNHFGVIGLKLLKFSCSAAVIIFVALAIAETGASISTQLGVLLLTAIGLTIQMQFRPQMFDFVFFSATVWLLARDSYRGSSPLWLAIPMLALWSNFHGGFFIGLLAMGLYAGVIGMTDVIAHRGIGRAMRIGIITMLGFLATFANPLGLETWRTIIVSIRNPLTARVMADWRPLLSRLASASFPGVISLHCWYAIALMAALAITFVLAPWAGDLAMVAVAVLMSAAALAATRNISLAAIAIAPPLARRLAILSARRKGVVEGPSRRSLGSEVVVAVLALLVAWNTGLFSGRMSDSLAPPSGAIAFMDAHGLKGNILNEFAWGQYLIWHQVPASKIFIDGRFDLVYPPQVIRDYVSFLFATPDARRVLTSYPHDLVLITPQSGAFNFMNHQADWKLIYDDPHAALFARADSAAAELEGIPVHGQSGPNEFP